MVQSIVFPRRTGDSPRHSPGLECLQSPRRLEAQDATLSRWKPRVRIPPGAPPSLPGPRGKPPAIIEAMNKRKRVALHKHRKKRKKLEAKRKQLQRAR